MRRAVLALLLSGAISLVASGVVLAGTRLNDEERAAVYGGWRDVRTVEDVEEQEGLVDRYGGRNPGIVDQSDAAIAREMLKNGARVDRAPRRAVRSGLARTHHCA